MPQVPESRVLSVRYVGGYDELALTDDVEDAFKTLTMVLGADPGVFRVGASDPLRVSALSTPALKVQVGLGYAWLGDRLLKNEDDPYQTPQFVAPTTHPRIDLIEANSSGFTVKTGAEGAVPVQPETDSGYLLLATVYLRPGMTSIKDTDDGVNGYITDMRVYK